MATKTPRQIITEPTLLILNEKHAKWYFLLKNDEELFALCLQITKVRLEQNYWYYDEEPVESLDFQESDIPNMPKSMQEEAAKKLAKYKADVRYFNANQDKTAATKIVKEKNGRQAYYFLLDRSNTGEYEGFDLELLTNIKDYE